MMLPLDIVFWIDKVLLFYRPQVKLYASETSELSIDHNETILNAMVCKRKSEKMRTASFNQMSTLLTNLKSDTWSQAEPSNL